MSAAALAAREADDPANGCEGYYLIVTMASGRVYRGALRRPKQGDGAHAVGTVMLDVNEQGEKEIEQHTLYLNEAQIECVEVEW